jgi:hypothetical protein
MNQEEIRLDVSRVRRRVREIDLQVRQIQAEDRLFHRYGFGSDVHDIQLTALRVERRELDNQLERLQVARGFNPSGGQSLRSWLLLPAALGALLVNAVWPRRQRRRPRPVFAD